MKKILYLLIIIASFWSCKKNTVSPDNTGIGKIATTDTVGNLIGMISPASAVTEIAVTTGNSARVSVRPDAGGKFKFTGLPAGSYILSFTTTDAYNPPLTSPLTVTAGQTTDAGTLAFVQAVAGIYGAVAPAGAASSISVTNAVTKASVTVTPDPASGSFNFKNLAPGNYIMSFKAVAPSKAPADTTLTLAKNAMISLSPIVFQTPGVTGTISGSVDPAGSVNTVEISNTANETFLYLHPDPNSGKFSTPQLMPGTYQVGFSTDRTHLSPGTRNVVLSPGQELDLGSIKMILYLHTLTYTLDGVYFPGFSISGCVFNAPSLQFGGSSSDQIPEDPPNGISLQINLDNVNSIGSYTISGTATSNITYKSGNPYRPNVWTAANGGAGTVVITSIDPVQKIISGTFTGILTPFSNATGNRTITNGAFQMTY